MSEISGKKSVVAVVPCDTYDEEKVYGALRKGVELLGGIGAFVKPEERILVKPNFLLAADADKAATTHPAVMRGMFRLLQEEGYAHRLVKAADRIAAYIKCVEERQAGNREFLAAEQTILQSIEAIDLPEVQAFFAQCVPAFGLSLDELSAGEVEP